MSGDALSSWLSAEARVYDLALPLFQGMPSGPTHPPYLFSLTKLHGDVKYAEGASSANDMIVMGTHVGTHIDGLGHVSKDGRLWGGRAAADVQSLSGGIGEIGIETMAPIVRRGLLLDVAAATGVEILDPGHEISPADLHAAAELAGAEIQTGDVALIRTGWARHWPDASRYQAHPAPGPGLDGARWLIERGVAVTGADTPAYEKTPARGMAVHVALLVEAGMPIIEMLDLEQLAIHAVRRFVFVALPLKIVGGTASPIRPIAIA